MLLSIILSILNKDSSEFIKHKLTFKLIIFITNLQVYIPTHKSNTLTKYDIELSDNKLLRFIDRKLISFYIL